MIKIFIKSGMSKEMLVYWFNEILWSSENIDILIYMFVFYEFYICI